MRRLCLAEFLLKHSTDSKELHAYKDMNDEERRAVMAQAGLDDAQQAAVLSGEEQRVIEALRTELKGVVDDVERPIMQMMWPFFPEHPHK